MILIKTLGLAQIIHNLIGANIKAQIASQKDELL